MLDPADLISSRLSECLPPPAVGWLDESRRAIAGGAPERRFFMDLSSASRHSGKAPLGLDPGAIAAADRARPGWRPGHWTCDQAARALLLLSLPHSDPGAYLRTLDRYFECADLSELVAGYQALPLLACPELLVARCAEGVRTNMTDVFRAVAHHNPFPKERLDEEAWNQMVLKSLFSGVELAPIQGLDERANPDLMRMACDYAHERWAAGREVSPELWRCVGPFADDQALQDLARVLDQGDAEQRAAAKEALGRCPRPEAKPILAAHQEA